MKEKLVYMFNEGSLEMKNVLGGKGANLSEMIKMGIPVPNGFTVSTKACNMYYENKSKLFKYIDDEIKNSIINLEKNCAQKFGEGANPLLLSVRSGSRVSMPGMMDTILNIGLNDKTVSAIAKNTNRRLAYDSYRRLIQMFGNVVKKCEMSLFEDELNKIKEKENSKMDTDISADNLEILVSRYKSIYKKEVGEAFPQDVNIQLLESIDAVFNSWNTQRAIIYRKKHSIPASWGTAVNIQQMVFGNKNNNSGTGVIFTRNPANGEKGLYGEYLINSQGEDVVAGIRTPSPIYKLKAQFPKLYSMLENYCNTLEYKYKDMQDIEFTIDDGKLYLLQTRNGKRTAKASLRIAVELVEEGIINKEDAVLMIDAKHIRSILHPKFDEKSLINNSHIASGLPASPGAATGRVVFNSKDAIAHSKKNENVILVRQETSPEDIEGMYASKGVLTERGGMTSHAAVVARGMGLPCIVGCNDIIIDEESSSFRIGDKIYKKGEIISLDGSTGYIYHGDIEKKDSKPDKYFNKLIGWAKSIKTMGVMANADKPSDVKRAILYGAEGVGLCRTEHMFFDPDRLTTFRKMILAEDKKNRMHALEELFPMQLNDFERLFYEIDGKPITIRLLDPPLHEFLPKTKNETIALSKKINVSLEKLEEKINQLKEQNPMLGHRGVRLSITYPEIAIMQASAIINAAIKTSRKTKKPIKVEIMLPLISIKKEIDHIKKPIIEKINSLLKNNELVSYEIGTMIEVPRACLMADDIAKSASFFSFGTNDLTQLTYGFSRDDSSSFLNYYLENSIIKEDPFSSFDLDGVGALVKIATRLGRKTNPKLKIGICGEHAAEQSTIEFASHIGIDYVSCNAFRIPQAILKCAHIKIKTSKK